MTGKPLVPEFLQEQVNGPALGQALLKQLTDGAAKQVLQEEFLKVHRQLRVGAADRAAQAILDLLNERRVDRALPL